MPATPSFRPSRRLIRPPDIFGRLSVSSAIDDSLGLVDFEMSIFERRIGRSPLANTFRGVAEALLDEDSPDDVNATSPLLPMSAILNQHLRATPDPA